MAIDLKNLKKVKSFDFDKYDGMKSNVASVEETDVEKKDFGEGEKEVKQLVISTENLESEEKPVYAKEFIALKKDDDGEWGIPENTNSKAMKVLKYFNVDNFADLIGKECMVVKRVNGDKTILGIYGG